MAEEALTMEPSYAPAHLQLGDVYMDLGWLESAADCYRAALAADEYAAAARYRLVHSLAEGGRLRAAEQQCRDFLAAQETPTLYLALAETLERQERLVEALAACDRAVALDERCARAHARRARLQCTMGDYDEAAAAARAALAIDPGCAEAHASLGLASAHRDDFMGAYSHAVKAEQGGIDMAEVWSLLQRQN
jgi:tetratricopeptide (TPR) repeat protein